MTKIKRMLMVTQLSNYDTSGKFILECDSGWQMCINRVREMLKLVPDLYIDITGPERRQLKTGPKDVNPDLWSKHGDDGDGRLSYVQLTIIPNAVATRYDFQTLQIKKALLLGIDPGPGYDIVYMNDPMLLTSYKTLFDVYGKYKPKFVVHNHFVDDPVNPKFPTETSLWMGQVEAAYKADINFWQCETTMRVVLEQIAKEYPCHVDHIMDSSYAWDDGYSQTEINGVVNINNLRFDPVEFQRRVRGKTIIFVPNRVGGRMPGEEVDRSSDFTRCGRFLREVLPKLRQLRQDFIVIAGNPNQKFKNSELEELCGPSGYISLVPDAFNRDEFKFIARNSAITVGLYDVDTYGGTVARECIEFGSLPFWCDCNEYAIIAREAQYPFLCKPLGTRSDLSDVVKALSVLMDFSGRPEAKASSEKLRSVVRTRCSYESTTPAAMKKMGLL